MVRALDLVSHSHSYFEFIGTQIAMENRICFWIAKENTLCKLRSAHVLGGLRCVTDTWAF